MLPLARVVGMDLLVLVVVVVVVLVGLLLFFDIPLYVLFFSIPDGFFINKAACFLDKDLDVFFDKPMVGLVSLDCLVLLLLLLLPCLVLLLDCLVLLLLEPGSDDTNLDKRGKAERGGGGFEGTEIRDI